MTDRQTHWQQLNAYVDGELDPQAKAEMAAAIAQDRSLADAAATLTRLKAVTNMAFADAPAVPIRPARSLRMLRGTAALAAATGVAAMLAVIWLAHVPASPPDVDAAIGRHAAWAAADLSAAREPPAAPMLVGLAGLRRPVEIPDLRDAGLQIARITTLDDTHGPAGLHIAYLGSRGCRVSLMVAAAEPGQGPLRHQHGTTAVFRWVAEDLTYSLISSGMPEERFALIAAAAEEAVRRHAPAPASVRQALRRDRAASPPCIA